MDVGNILEEYGRQIGGDAFQVSKEKDNNDYKEIVNHIGEWYKLYTTYNIEIAAYYLRWFYLNFPDIWAIAVFGEKGEVSAQDAIDTISKISDSLSPEFIIPDTYFKAVPVTIKIKDNKYLVKSPDTNGELLGLLPCVSSYTQSSINFLINEHASKYSRLTKEINKQVAEYKEKSGVNYEDDAELLDKLSEMLSQECFLIKRENPSEEIIKIFDEIISDDRNSDKLKEDFELAKKLYQTHLFGCDLILVPVCRAIEYEMNEKLFDPIKKWLNSGNKIEIPDKNSKDFSTKLYCTSNKITLGFLLGKITADSTDKCYRAYYKIIEKINNDKSFEKLKEITDYKFTEIKKSFSDIRNCVCHRGESIETINKKADALLEEILKFLHNAHNIISSIHTMGENFNELCEDDKKELKKKMKEIIDETDKS